jgi:hypothetical protein
MADKRALLIAKLKSLSEAHNEKQRQYQLENNLSSEVGCFTKEICLIASLMPLVWQLGVTVDEYR